MYRILKLFALGVLASFSSQLFAEEKENPDAQPKMKIAVIDLGRSFQAYFQRTKEAKEIEVNLAPIRKANQARLQGIEKWEGRLGELQEKLQEGKTEVARKLRKDIKEAEEALEALQRERREFLVRRLKTLGQKKLKILADLRDAHLKEVQAYVKEKKYDYVFDTSGNSGGHPMSLPLFSEDSFEVKKLLGNFLVNTEANDITDDVIALGKDAAPKE